VGYTDYPLDEDRTLESYLPLKEMQEKLSFRKYASPCQIFSEKQQSILRKKRIVDSARRIVEKMSTLKNDSFEFYILLENSANDTDNSITQFKLSSSCPAASLENKAQSVTVVEADKSVTPLSEKPTSIVKFNLEPKQPQDSQQDAPLQQAQVAPKKRVNVALASMMNNPMPLESTTAVSSSKTNPSSSSAMNRPATTAGQQQLPQQKPLLSQPVVPPIKINNQTPVNNFPTMQQQQTGFPSNSHRNQVPLLNQYQGSSNVQPLPNQQQQQSFFPSASTRQFNQQPSLMNANFALNKQNNNSNIMQQQQQQQLLNSMNSMLVSNPAGMKNPLMNSGNSLNSLNSSSLTNNGFPNFLPSMNDTPPLLSLNNPSSDKLDQMIRNFEMQQKSQQSVQNRGI
jgi:hypothetical protein